MTPTDPAPPEPAIQAAARLLAEGRPAEAARELAALVASAPTYAAAHVLRATALEAAGFVDEAIVSWGRAAALVPRSPLVHRERARLLASRLAEEPPPDLPAAEPDPARQSPEADAAEPDAPEPGAPEPKASEPAVPEEVAPESASSETAPFHPPAGPDSDAQPASILPPEATRAPEPPDFSALDSATPDTETAATDSSPATPDEPGWNVLAEVDVPTPPPGTTAEPDVIAPESAPPPGDPVADDLDALITQLEDAPRIRPDPDYRGPEVALDADDTDDVASETLAQIYAAQHQYGQAALVYETLAARQPERADVLLERAAELRGRRR